jgi:hypothetical protein
MPAGIEAGVEITLDPVWKEMAPKTTLGEAKEGGVVWDSGLTLGAKGS